MEDKQNTEEYPTTEKLGVPTGIRAPSPANKKARTGWIYTECGLESQGTVEELRKRFSTFIAERNYSVQIGQYLNELELRHGRAPSPRESLGGAEQTTGIVPGAGQTSPTSGGGAQTVETRDPRAQQRGLLGNARGSPGGAPIVEDRTFDRVPTWAIRFQEGDSPIDFLERVEELAWCQGIPVDQIPFTLSEVLGGRALAWWRNRRYEWRDWIGFKTAFLKYFLPSTYTDDLDGLIRQRKQREGEPFGHYALDLETLTRHANFSTQQQLDRIYRNSNAEIQLLVKRHEFTTLDELTDLVAHVERVRAEMPRRMVEPWQGPPTTPQKNPRPGRWSQTEEKQGNQQPRPVVTDTKPNGSSHFDRLKERCYRCAEIGHTGRGCQSAPVLFCWVCGQKGVRTRECCKQENTQLRTTRVNEQPEVVSVDNLTSDGRNIWIRLTLGQMSRQALVDTGSWTSYVSQDMVQQLPPGFGRRRRHVANVILANGETQPVEEKWGVTMIIGERRFPMTLLVLPSAMDPFIVGMDFLVKAQTTITIGTMGVRLATPTTEVVRSQRTTTTPEPNPQEGPRSVQERLAEALQTYGLPLAKEQEIKETINTELEAFARIKGPSTAAVHRIIMKDDQPIKQRYFPKNPAMQAVINEKVDELLEKGCIEPSNSAYSAPVVLVRKKNGQWRMCVDYRQLNAHSITDAYPLPRINHNLSRLRDAKVTSSLDLKDGYWQIPVDPDSRKCTAFTVPGRGLF